MTAPCKCGNGEAVPISVFFSTLSQCAGLVSCWCCGNRGCYSKSCALNPSSVSAILAVPVYDCAWQGLGFGGFLSWDRCGQCCSWHLIGFLCRRRWRWGQGQLRLNYWQWCFWGFLVTHMAQCLLVLSSSVVSLMGTKIYSSLDYCLLCCLPLGTLWSNGGENLPSYGANGGSQLICSLMGQQNCGWRVPYFYVSDEGILAASKLPTMF